MQPEAAPQACIHRCSWHASLVIDTSFQPRAIHSPQTQLRWHMMLQKHLYLQSMLGPCTPRHCHPPQWYPKHPVATAQRMLLPNVHRCVLTCIVANAHLQVWLVYKREAIGDNWFSHRNKAPITLDSVLAMPRSTPVARSSSAWWAIPGPLQPAQFRAWEAFVPGYDPVSAGGARDAVALEGQGGEVEELGDGGGFGGIDGAVLEQQR